MNTLGSTEVTSHPTCLFLKLQARAQEAKVVALSSVVTGKEVESDAIALHRELQSECLFFPPSDLFFSLFFTLSHCRSCIMLFIGLPAELFHSKLKCQVLTPKQTQALQTQYDYNKCVIAVAML